MFNIIFFNPKNGKLFNKINIIDLFFIFIFVLIIFGIVYRLTLVDSNTNKNLKKIYYNITIKDIKKNSAKYFKTNMRLKDKNTGIDLGYIEEKKINDFFDYIIKSNGEIRISRKPEKIELILKINSLGKENDDNYLINGVYEIKNGDNIYFFTKYCEMFGTVSDVK